MSSAGIGAAMKLDASGEKGATQHFPCYACSEDEVNWEKPFLGLYDYEELNWNGTRIGTVNNILPSIDGIIRGPLYHAAEPDPNRRYKGLCYRSRGLYTYVSPDAIHWEELDLPPQPSAGAVIRQKCRKCGLWSEGPAEKFTNRGPKRP